ncbi:MAG: hypothetical protein OXU61_07185, partial [Gammaproteobacteria bacterium]|nr:hypothetical protein [Gammaproteobacteria bacterium]
RPRLADSPSRGEWCVRAASLPFDWVTACGGPVAYGGRGKIALYFRQQGGGCIWTMPAPPDGENNE